MGEHDDDDDVDNDDDNDSDDDDDDNVYDDDSFAKTHRRRMDVLTGVVCMKEDVQNRRD